MRDSKLYKTLRLLDGHALNRLHRFITSPYFNRSQAIISLFESLKQDLRDQSSPEPKKEELWKLCYPGEPEFSDGRFRKLQSDLLKLIEEFYAQENFEANPVHKAKYLLESIYDNNLEELKSSTLKSAQQLVEHQEKKPASYYFYKYEIEQSLYYLSRIESERSSKSNIEEIAENLDRFYLAEKLRYYCTILNHQHLAALNYNMLFIDEIIRHVESNDYSDVPPIVIYHRILLSYQNPENVEHYHEIKKLINQHIHLFPENEVAEILDSALNYCIKRMNSGEIEYVQEAYDLYKKWLGQDLLLVKGKIDPFHFKNVVTAGLRLSQFDWVEKFIHKYNQYLDVRFRENAVTFNLAQFYFYKKEYSNVISQLSQVEYDDITYNLNSKILLMASYFELDEIEALNSLLDTFRVYLNRNKKIPATRRKHYLNTISIVRKLGRIKQGDIGEIHKLEKEIEKTQGIVSKNWILEKLEGLKA